MVKKKKVAKKKKVNIKNLSLTYRQNLPLSLKVKMSKQRIREWHKHWKGQVYVSFSGGKDSLVLLHLVRSIYPNVPAVFVDTGLEYPEIKDFVKTIPNVTTLRPKKSFIQVIEDYGYPVISKNVSRYVRDLQNPTPNNVRTRDVRLGKTNSIVGVLSKKWRFLVDAPFKCSEQCCDVMKKQPIKKYNECGRKAFIGMMAEESNARRVKFAKSGCNAFDQVMPQSNPLSFWLTKDVWAYIKKHNIPYSKIYDMGVRRTGCMFCMFGVQMENEPNRFQCMKDTHPVIHKYCMEKLGLKDVLDYIGVKSE